MDEERHAELLYTSIERLQPRMIDVVVSADAARNVDADQPELLDHAVKLIDGGLRILQRHDTARPDTARIAPLRLTHLIVVHARVVDAVSERNFGEERRERPERAHKIDVVAGGIHMPDVVIQIEPDFAPIADDADAPVSRMEIIAADAVAFGARIAVLALAQIVEHRSREPVNMTIKNSHRALLHPYCALPGSNRFTQCTIRSLLGQLWPTCSRHSSEALTSFHLMMSRARSTMRFGVVET